jgi:hypothetical protein
MADVLGGDHIERGRHTENRATGIVARSARYGLRFFLGRSPFV